MLHLDRGVPDQALKDTYHLCAIVIDIPLKAFAGLTQACFEFTDHIIGNLEYICVADESQQA